MTPEGPPGPGGPLLALVGPTGSGKTEASLPIAEALHAEIVCVDSMLVYRGMDVAMNRTPTDPKSTAFPSLGPRMRGP